MINKKEEEMSSFITGLLLSVLFICYAWSCSDDYMTMERRVINADNNVPVYFYADAEQGDSFNSWRPVFTYYVYLIEEGEYDAYFHAYCMDGDSIIWSGIQPIRLEGGKKTWGEYVSSANFTPENIENVTPMAYVSVEYE